MGIHVIYLLKIYKKLLVSFKIYQKVFFRGFYTQNVTFPLIFMISFHLQYQVVSWGAALSIWLPQLPEEFMAMEIL